MFFRSHECTYAGLTNIIEPSQFLFHQMYDPFTLICTPVLSVDLNESGYLTAWLLLRQYSSVFGYSSTFPRRGWVYKKRTWLMPSLVRDYRIIDILWIQCLFSFGAMQKNLKQDWASIRSFFCTLNLPGKGRTVVQSLKEVNQASISLVF